MEQVYQEIVQFIRDLYNKPLSSIPLHEPVFGGNEERYLKECLDSTFVSSVGPFVDRFEEDIAKYTGAKKAVACVNGTSALHLALKLVGVEKETEVLTQPLTFVATVNAIKYCGAEPVFLDVDIDTMGLSPDCLRIWLEQNVILKNKKRGTQGQAQRSFELLPFNKTSGRQISACIPMHTYGHPCRIDEIVTICKKYNIPVVEDAAESLGSLYKQKHTGTFGDIGVLSFNGNKIITTGGGGMLLFRDEEKALEAKHLSTQAKVAHPWEFIHDQVGFNYRLPNINAALGVAQLEQLENYIGHKRQAAQKYRDFFNSIGIRFFSEPENSRSNYWLNLILLNDRKERDDFLKYSNENGIMTRPAWQLMNKLKMFKNSYKEDLPNSKWFESRIINLPSGIQIR